MSQARIAELQAELALLLAESKEETSELKSSDHQEKAEEKKSSAFCTSQGTLDSSQVARYSRQVILPEIGVVAQSKICKASVLIVGCGGLGSPCALYLAGCGIGRIGLVDCDDVELNNLHRQIIHTEKRVGQHKVDSAAAAIKEHNSSVQVTGHKCRFQSSNAVEIISEYDIVVDASDNAVTRYLINDAAVLCGKPLVSGAAIGMEGQLTVYHCKLSSGSMGPCYRCLFPKPPPPETVPSCANAGVLGVVPGVIGTLQALEALKLAGSFGTPMAGSMLLFDALSGSIRNIKLRASQTNCEVCGNAPKICRESLASFQYEAFCSSAANDKLPGVSTEKTILPSVSCEEYNNLIQSLTESKSDSAAIKKLADNHLLVDVRDATQFAICSLPNAVNIPFKELGSRISELDLGLPIYVMCRRGVLSQKATKLILEHYQNVFDVRGGITQWQRSVDHDFPLY